MYNYIVDWEEFFLIKHYLQPNDTVADVGANMGFYTIWMSKFIGPNGKIFSFEPDALNYQRLQKNVAINHLSTPVTVVQKGVSCVSGVSAFTKGLDGENHIALTRQHGTVDIETVTLDEYMHTNQVQNLAYVKVDVEGFELAVIKGACNYMKGKKIKILQLEINQTLQNSGTHIQDLLAAISKYDYTLCEFNIEKKLLIPIKYSASRENYFAVADLEEANQRMREQ